ncbi:hypothetical protein B0H14DRAFT_3497485 [Mycena olivaceomarginata]|nr:hypothetical protein B0H14DRAFT_3497485 [Mycena olivaceomarginata]
MAFKFLSSDFFNVQGHDSYSPSPVLPATPRNPRPRPAVPETSFASSGSQYVNMTNFSPFPRDSPQVPALSMDTPAPACYVPKAFVYNTPINPHNFGTIPDSGYSSLSSRTSHYHSPLTPATPLPNKPTPCETYLQLYNSGDLQACGGPNNSWELQCIICDKWVRTAVPTRRPLSIANHFSNLESHCTSSKCISHTTRASTAPPVLSPRKAPAASSSAIPPAPVDDENDEEDDDHHFQCVFSKYSSTTLLTWD